jgi:hypothetical protein
MNKEEMRIDEIAQNLCKPLGCRIVRCMGKGGTEDCSGYRREYL